ncbi:UDP-N-acetylmuramate:L-alanyl-gamma-D-glutamyl-meso-diaminopimelate ligase [Desulfatitalea tepidiphila]|uniref:UDP-N-acetylmuramate:L-alanyl-gamma-D-glutamyl- meso-diaminopimelate ligase n=1 Tax=Desulfatitalea tepidiphila TaxID=1185843 RepID=UPI0006B43401|nr:UDP-N-acetylmuramate:L-alanyl-gamma-D-glutamyl-meso-diaminopimelate ligase [Desulfatitalea tepidiphila]
MPSQPAIRSYETIRHIHLIAVCGTAMGALACMLKEMGYAVTGSDQHVYPPMSDFLRAKDIAIFEGFSGRNLEQRPDLVVVGNAVSRENPEVQAMYQLNLAYCSMPQAINRFAAAGKKQIVITGTHGKTTTSSFIAWLLHCARLDPSFLIGGLLADFQSNYKVGSGDWMVLEGDEYDTAFFDKGPKFLHYTPEFAVLTSIEFDHADIYSDLDHVKQAFEAFLKRLTSTSSLVAYDSDHNVAELMPGTAAQVVTYGNDPKSAWRLGRVDIQPPYTLFETYHHGEHFADFKTRMIGRHNLGNLLAGIAIGERMAIDTAVISQAVESFKGVRRRQEVRGVKNHIVVIDDFAHHPTAVMATLEAVKSFYGSRRLMALFEPRTNTSRRNVFQSIYPSCFDAADLICIRQAPLLEKIPEDQRFSSMRLVEDIKKRGGDAHFFEDTDGIISFVVSKAQPGDVILVMSNGGFDNIHQRLLESL